jgi:hypothetical protein
MPMRFPPNKSLATTCNLRPRTRTPSNPKKNIYISMIKLRLSNSLKNQPIIEQTVPQSHYIALTISSSYEYSHGWISFCEGWRKPKALNGDLVRISYFDFEKFRLSTRIWPLALCACGCGTFNVQLFFSRRKK